jgi:hypothetical protein
VHIAAGFDDLAHRLVPQHRARAHLGQIPLEDVQVRPADGGDVDAHDRVGGLLDVGVRNLFPA